MSTLDAINLILLIFFVWRGFLSRKELRTEMESRYSFLEEFTDIRIIVKLQKQVKKLEKDIEIMKKDLTNMDKTKKDKK